MDSIISWVLAILQSARSYCRLLWERWLHPLHLLGPVLLGCCWFKLTSLSSMIDLQPPLLCEGWGGHPLFVSGTVQYWWISIGLVIGQLTTVFCPSVQYLSFFCETFSWTILDSSSLSLFHSGQVFHELVRPLTVVLPQIFFNLTTLFSYPVFFCLFHAPLMLLFTSLYFSDPSGSNLFFASSLLSSLRSRIYAVTHVFSSSSFDDVCQGPHWLF